PRLIDAVSVDRVIVALGSRDGLPVQRLLQARARGVRFDWGRDIYEKVTGKIAIEELTPFDVIFSPDGRFSRGALALSRICGAAAAGLGLILLSPLLVAIAIAIRLDSPGPVFFVQDRVGRGGRPFQLLKFRTMRSAARPASEWVRDNGHRITRVGRWLRRFRLDEIPQLFNVVRGDMNLVGPRPHPAVNYPLLATVMRNTPDCGAEIPFYSLRTLVRPGITGWAQIRYGYANGVEEEVEKLRYDLYYLKNQSVLLDLQILAETIGCVLFGKSFEGATSRSPRKSSGAVLLFRRRQAQK
ncbi:MAG TPA: sugar transferase, partial [Candidatus Polarisedimenticolaceae bacterium]|nr:sugar transferase [Candidatus Polarisedimenticolaceae bacterium]